MKKIVLLTICIFLLFPIAIYFGNLADVPASKKVIVYLRDLVGMSTSKSTSAPVKRKILKLPAPFNHIGLAESWRKLGTNNFADLLAIVSAPGKHDAWQASIGDFLNDPLHSAAFFSSSWCFWQTRHEKLSLIGYYQPWIDVMMLIQIAEVNGSYKAEAIGMIESKKSIVASTTVSKMAEELNSRLQSAEQAFQSVSANPDAIDGMLNPVEIKKSRQLLDQYATDLRKKLDAKSTDTPSLAILDWLDSARSGQIEDVQKLLPASDEWLKHLQPVHLVKIDSEHWLLAASDNSLTGRILMVELQINEHKAFATQILLWDAATAGSEQ